MEASDYLVLGIIFGFVILWGLDVFVKPWYKNKQPIRFKESQNRIYYFSIRFGCWRPVYVWSDEDKERDLLITDTIRGLTYMHKYIGKGREYIIHNHENLNHICSLFKTNKEIDDEQIRLIDKENNYLRQVIK